MKQNKGRVNQELQNVKKECFEKKKNEEKHYRKKRRENTENMQ